MPATPALPEEITVAGRRYDVIPIRQVRHHGETLDALACHDSRRVFISRCAPPAVLAAAIEQVRRETALMLLTAGPVERVA